MGDETPLTTETDLAKSQEYSASRQSRVHKEGATALVVPEADSRRKSAVFFNPGGEFVRHVSIDCYRTYACSLGRSEFTFADALCGVGSRGVRVACEVSEVTKVFLNDVSSYALSYARRSIDTNSVNSKCVLSRREACSFLSTRDDNLGERFDIVDLDPYGSPSQFVESGIRAVKHNGMLSMTATDSAVLCGLYPLVARRKYLGLPLRTDYSHEVGIRLLFGLLAMSAMRLEAGIVPLFSHHDAHYFRVYAAIQVGNRYSRNSAEKIGHVVHCFNCGYRSTILCSDRSSVTETATSATGPLFPECPNCSDTEKRTLKIGGPCWVDKIQSRDFVGECARVSDRSLFKVEELDTALYYDLTVLSQQLRVRAPGLSQVIMDLESSGFKASRTRLNPTAVRTDAPLPDLLSVVERQARKTP